MIMATCYCSKCFWMPTSVEGVVSVIWALVAVGTGGVGGLIWAEQVLSARCVEPVDPDADGDPELPGSDCIPNGAVRDSVNACMFLQKCCILSRKGVQLLRSHKFM